MALPSQGSCTRPWSEGVDTPDVRSLVALGAAGFTVFLGVYATQPLLPGLARTLGVGKSAVALTLSAPTIAIALLSPVAGALGERIGYRRLVTASLLLLVAPTLLAASSRNLWELVAWRFVQGVVVPGVYVGAIAFIATEWRSGTGRATSAYITGAVIGSASGRFVSGLVAEARGWRVSFVVLAGMTALGWLAATRLLPYPRHPAEPRPRRSLRGWTAVMDRRLFATCAVGFNILFTQMATFTYVTFHLAAAPFHVGPGTLGWIFLVYLVGAVVTPLTGPLIDRFGSRAALGLALGSAIAGIAATLVPALWIVTIGLAICCTATFVSQSASTAYLAVAVRREDRSIASGLYVSSYYLGGSAGAALPALAWRYAGWPGCVALIAAVQAVTILLALATWKPPVLPRTR